jgi:hypothetical protein
MLRHAREHEKKMKSTERLNRTALSRSFAPIHFHPHTPRLRRSGALHKAHWRDTLRRVREHKKENETDETPVSPTRP